ncbi:MAG TPA: sigma-70 family RNA polymerase sigma factor [Nocardioides sp.]|nr:sigma-70 family RNA polymerase sigma factor [Nocardioides sp.]
MTTEQQPSDAELISAVRGGDTMAYGELFTRHVESARRLARQLTSATDVEDLVSEAFAKVLTIVRRGGGPDLAFRAYLLTAVRSLHIDSVRGAVKLRPVDDFAPFDDGVPFRDTAVEGFENKAAARAFATLPERWQLVLWHTEVEGQKPAEVAKLLGMSANSVSALAYRAREGLRQAFLNMHAQDAEDDACAWTQDNLGAYIRNAASKRDSIKVRAHVDECRRCMGIYLELSEVNTNLSGILGPIVLGSAAAGYIAAVGAAAQGGMVGVLGRVGDIVGNHSSSFALAGAAAVIVLITGLVLGLRGPAPDDSAPLAEAPVITSPATQGISPGAPTLRPDRPVPSKEVPSPTPQDDPVTSPTPSTSAPEQPSDSPDGSDDPGDQSSLQEDQPDGTIDVPSHTPSSPPPTVEPVPEVDAELSAREREIDPTFRFVRVEVTGLAEQGGVLEITSTNNAQLVIGGDCPERVCAVAPEKRYLNFSIDSSDLHWYSEVHFTITPAGDVIDPDLDNNTDTVELEPAP